jgi:hypothetical protein
MQIHVVEWGTAPTVSPVLTLLRAQLTALTFPSPYLSEAERLLANHHIHECEDEERLLAWLRNVATEIARREAAYYGQCIALNTRTTSPIMHC